MITLECTEFNAIKDIMHNVEAIYEIMDSQGAGEDFNLGVTACLEKISGNLFKFLERKPLASYVQKGVKHAAT